MSIKLKYNSFLAYSEQNKKYFYSKFIDGINIVYGKNTSGKSMLMQSILYTFGINDETSKLQEILNENIFFRLDCSVFKDNKEIKLILIRDDETLMIKENNEPIKTFNGISGDSSAEHVKLKNYLHELFNFTLHLESKGTYKVAPIETMFLPYYISQDVGWVYLRKSFSSLDFYKNFKEDFLDYYLGINNSIDRVEKQKKEKELKEINIEIEFYTSVEKSNDDLQISKMEDESYLTITNQYIEKHKDRQDTLVANEKEYILKCNELAYQKERLSVLSRVKQNTKKQNPTDNGTCPVCTQKLNIDIASIYQYSQNENNTDSELIKTKTNIKTIQSKINSLQKSIKENKAIIEKEYKLLKQHSQQTVSYDTWLNNKVNTQLIENIIQKLEKLVIKKTGIDKELLQYKSEEDILIERRKRNHSFSNNFQTNLTSLAVKPLEEKRYTELYGISSFPSQGVELHKTVMAYHFALNKLVYSSGYAHRFPFMLDAIFKEDIETDNKNIIIDFIGKNKPSDTQMLISIAEPKEGNNVQNYNKKYFDNKAHLICLGDLKKERAFLIPHNDEYQELINETINILHQN